MSEQVVGLVGVGAMGWPMGANILKSGRQLIVYDADHARAERFSREVGGTAVCELSAVAEAASTIITMLPTSKIVSEVILGEAGLARYMTAGSVVIEMTSGSPDVTVAIGKTLTEKGVRIMDAPVSGGVVRAVSGELTIMTGGDTELVDSAMPLLSTMGSNIVHVGSLGSGQAMKALNNLVSAGGFLIGIEALLIGQKFGVDPDKMVDILNSSTGMNNSTKNKFKQFVLSRRFSEGGFGIGLMAKDLGIALDIAKSTGVPAPFAAHCAQMWAAASAMVGPGEDHTSIARMCEQFAGIVLGEPAAAQ
jgi:3-hydroxyisobutyrate dehydrogenase